MEWLETYDSTKYKHILRFGNLRKKKSAVYKQDCNEVYRRWQYRQVAHKLCYNGAVFFSKKSSDAQLVDKIPRRCFFPCCHTYPLLFHQPSLCMVAKCLQLACNQEHG